MTTELEQEFFKVFGVEPIKYILPLGQNSYWQDNSRIMQEVDYKIFKIIENDLTEEDKKLVKFIYPEITDRVLLELIFRLIKYEETFEDSQFKNIKELKNYILAKCISIKTTGDKWLARQIQQLFKEGK